MFDRQKVVLVLFLVVVALAVFYVFKTEYLFPQYSPSLTKENIFGSSLVQNTLVGETKCDGIFRTALQDCNDLRVYGPWYWVSCSSVNENLCGGDVECGDDCVTFVPLLEDSPCGGTKCRQVRVIDRQLTQEAVDCCIKKAINAYYQCTPQDDSSSMEILPEFCQVIYQ